MSLPDTAEYWNDVKKRHNSYRGKLFYHHPTYQCSHINVVTGNIQRIPYKNGINCFECLKAIEEGNLEGIKANEIPPTYFMSKKERKVYNEQQKTNKTFGKCDCGEEFHIKVNRTNLKLFLGCSTFPKCRKTKSIE